MFSRKIKRVSKSRQNNTSLSGPGKGPDRNVVADGRLPGFARKTYKTTLNYFDFDLTIATGAGTAGTRVYSANGLYDPDITGTGHQPMPFDQLMLSFEHYVVVAAELVCSFRNTSTTTPISVSISLNSSATPVTAIQQLVENGLIVRKQLGMYPHVGCQTTLRMPIKIGRFGGIPNVLDNPSFEGSAAANPTEQSYFHLSAWNPDTVSSIDCEIEVEIRYLAVFREPRKNSVSLSKAIYGLVLAETREKKLLAKARREEEVDRAETFLCVSSPEQRPVVLHQCDCKH